MSDGVEKLRLLERQVRATVKARMDREHGLANPAALRNATAQAYRDRDAVTSPMLEEARAQVSADVAAFHEQWHYIDKKARNLDRLGPILHEAPSHVLGHRDALVAAIPEARRVRARIEDAVRAAGLDGILPDEEITHGEG